VDDLAYRINAGARKTMTSPVKYTAENKVILEYNLSLPDGATLKGDKTCKTGDSLSPKPYYARKADSDGEFRHRNDPDAQLFDWLATEVWKHYGSNDTAYFAAIPHVTGTVTAYDDQGPCHSCRAVFKAFRKEYPGVVVTIRYKGDPNFATVAGLGGQYGYEKAVYDKGWWVVQVV
jgi:hypothetical protein